MKAVQKFLGDVCSSIDSVRHDEHVEVEDYFSSPSGGERSRSYSVSSRHSQQRSPGMSSKKSPLGRGTPGSKSIFSMEYDEY